MIHNLIANMWAIARKFALSFSYRVRRKADVGGKLAQLGGRLIEGTAKKLAGDFFNSFREAVAGPTEASIPVAATKKAGIGAVHPLVLIAGGVVLLVVLYFLIGSM